MEGSTFDEVAFFRAVAAAGVRALLIGRRAMVLLGVPVMTADYDYWLSIDDVERFNALARAFELHPTHPPDAARARGRYVLEGDEHVDVLVARRQSTRDGVPLAFDDAWARRETLDLGDATLAVPSLDDLIATKRWSMRPRDLADIELLEALRGAR